MKSATRMFVSTFGAFFALGGMEHGIGEVLQGNVAPAGLMILSWPESEFFRSVGGEPAMTVVPNLLITGILAILVSLILLVWATLFVQRKHGGLIMILLSLAMLLVGGGIFPPVICIIVGSVGTRINAPVTWWHAQPLTGLQQCLKKLWPWAYAAGIIAWLSMLPGLPLLGHFFGLDDSTLVLTILCFALGSLVLNIVTGLAYDARRPTGSLPRELSSQSI